MTTARLLAALLLASLAACAAPGSGADLAARVEAAHGTPGVYARPPLHADVTVDFGGRRVLDARMVYDSTTNRARLEHAGGAVTVFDGETAWAVGVPEEELGQVRFHLLTWPYFAAAPWKLDDEGGRLEPLDSRPLNGRPHEVARLTFADGVGDTPDDWYVVHVDATSGRLSALAYVATYGTSAAEAADPLAALYEEYAEVDGLLVPRRIAFRPWSEDDGVHGERIGTARFEDARFAPAPEGAFEAPAEAVRAPLPD